MKYKIIPKCILLLLALLLILAQTGLAEPWAAPLWGGYTGAGASSVGGTSGGSGLALVGGSYPPSRLARADYQQFYDEARTLYEAGYDFRYQQLTADPVGGELRYGSVISDVAKNYADFNDGALFYDFCANYDAVDGRGRCPEGLNPGTLAPSLNLRNDLLRARDMFAVLSVADPADMTITAGGEILNAREVGRRGVLSSTREIANIHMIFGNEFLADANDFVFSASATGGEEIIEEEIAQLELAQGQFMLATDVLVDAFNADIGGPFGVRIGDYFGAAEFDLFGVVSERLVETVDQLAQRHRLLGDDDAAAAIYTAAAQDQYLLVLALGTEAAEHDVSFYENGGWQMLQNLEYLNRQASALQEGLDPFGFEPAYVPWQTYDTLLGLLRCENCLLDDAEDDESEAAGAQREFDYNQSEVGGALQEVRETYDGELHELCGMTPDGNGDGVVDEGFVCEGGLMLQNYDAMLASATEIQLAWRRAANVVEQIEIEEERAGQVINITGGLGRQISAIELAIGKLNAVQTTSSVIDATSDTWHAEVEAEVRTYVKTSATLSANPFACNASNEAGIEASLSASSGYRHEQAHTEEVMTTFNLSALQIGEYESLRALQEAEATCQIEGIESDAEIRNLLLEQSELLIEHELAIMAWNRLADEHNYLVDRYHYLMNQRELAIDGLVGSYLNNPAYRILRDSFNIEAARSRNLAAQYAYMTAKAVEYDQLQAPSMMSDIFKARTADDVDNYLIQIGLVAQVPKPGDANRYPISLSLAEDIFGLTDEALDPQGTLSEAELAQLRYQLFQDILQDNTENGVLALTFTTSLLGDEVHFPSVVWNHRIVGVGSNLDPENAGESCRIDSPCEGVSVNLLTRQTDTFDDPPLVALTHAGQATYRNRDGEIVAYKPGPAMPVGWSSGGNPGNTTVQLRAQVNGEFNATGDPYNAGLMRLSVAASKWVLKIDTTQGAAADLVLAQLEDIVLDLDAHAFSIQGYALAAEDAAQASQARFAARPRQPVQYNEDAGDVLSRWEADNAARRAANAPLPTLQDHARAASPYAVAATEPLSGTFYGTVSITEPLGIGSFDFVLHLSNAGGTISGEIVPGETLLFSETVAITGAFDGSNYYLQSALFESPAPNPDERMNAQRRFTLTGPFVGDGKVLPGIYTETVTGFMPYPLHVAGEFLGTRTADINRNFGPEMTVTAGDTSVAPGGSTTVTATVLEEGQTITLSRRITFTTDLGTLGPVSVDTGANGYAVTTYTAPESEGTATITATDGILVDTTQVQITESDTEPPSVAGTSPIDQATGVAINANLITTFSEAMDTGSVTYSIGPVVALTPTWSNGDATLTLSHAHFLSNTTYSITIHTGTDGAGNDLDAIPYTWSFTTGSTVGEEHTVYLPLITKNR